MKEKGRKREGRKEGRKLGLDMIGGTDVIQM
jgi:hypothetical protein